MSAAALVSVLVTLLSAAVSLGVLVVAIRRTRREPRRLSNGFWLLAGSLLAVQLAAGLGVPGAGLLQGLLALLVVGAPVLIDVVAVFLIINGVIMLRRESRSRPTRCLCWPAWPCWPFRCRRSCCCWARRCG